MSTGARLLALLAAGVTLGGCVAAVAPLVAAGAIGAKRTLHRTAGRNTPPPAPVPPPPPPVAAAVPPAAMVARPSRSAAPPTPLPLPTHGWRAMVVHVADTVQAKTRPTDSAVLAPGATLAAPRFLPCEAKPYAVIVDAEGTVLPPLDALPGATVRTEEAARSLSDLRFGHVEVIFTSSRPLADVAAVEAALEHAGLGPAMQDRELLMSGSAAGATKNALRAAVARHYCVLALVGDEAADFSDALAAAGAPAATTSIWGTRWFRIPAQTATP